MPTSGDAPRFTNLRDGDQAVVVTLFPVSRDMHGSLCFDIDAHHFAHQLALEADRWELGALGSRCTDYLRLATGECLHPAEAPRLFPAMLRPARVPTERSVILGIHVKMPATGYPFTRLVGVLYFLHPHPRGDTWFIPLLLLEPSERGKGLGAAVHRAFARWAASRGATRCIVSVADNNPRGGSFWRDRLGYQAIDPARWQGIAQAGRHHELEHRLSDVATAMPWDGQAASER